MTNTNSRVEPFPTLQALQDEHAHLQSTVFKEEISPDVVKLLEILVRRAVLTGEVLDNSNDRRAAQAVINYWVSRFSSSFRERPGLTNPFDDPNFDALLAEFDPATLKSASDSVDEWLSDCPDDEILARSIVLRLLRLRDDGSFEMISSPDSMIEDLEPHDDVLRILKRLVSSGVVRMKLDSLGHREIALRSPEFIDKWPRLQEWLNKRKQFREAAENWERQKAASAKSDSQIWSKAPEYIRRGLSRAGTWIELRWNAFTASIKLNKSSTSRLAEEDFEEAEKYRDLSAVESKLIYQKRELDKERSKRNQALVAGCAVASLVFAGLFAWARLGWDKARDGRVEGDLKVANWQLRLSDYFLTQNSDASGSFLWSTGAFGSFASAKNDLTTMNRTEHLANYGIRLGVGQRQLPGLVGMVFQPDSLLTASTLDGKTLLTVGSQIAGVNTSQAQDRPPVPILWRKDEHGKWQHDELAWRSSPDGLSKIRGTYLDQHGTVAIITAQEGGETDQKDDDNATAYAWLIPHSTGRGYQRKKLPLPGRLISAAISPDGAWFATLSERTSKAGAVDAEFDSFDRVTVWNLKDSDNPCEWKVSKQRGRPGTLTFGPSSDRLALTMKRGLAESDPHSNNGSSAREETVVCLEWSLKSNGRFSDKSEPREYSTNGHVALGAEGDETFATYGNSGKDSNGDDYQFLFVTTGNKEGRPGCWLFNTKLKDTTTGLSSSLADQISAAHHGPIVFASFSSTGDKLSTAGSDGKVNVWQVPYDFDDDGQEKQNESKLNCLTEVNSQYASLSHPLRVFYCDFSPDGRFLVTACRDRFARVWEIGTRKLIYQTLFHVGTVDTCRFIENGRQIITSSSGVTYWWDLAIGEERPIVRADVPQDIKALISAADGRAVLAIGETASYSSDSQSQNGGARGGIEVFNPNTGESLGPWIPFDVQIRQAAISDKMPAHLCAVGTNGTAWICPVTSSKSEPMLIPSKPGEFFVHTAFSRNKENVFLLAVSRENPISVSGKSWITVWTVAKNGTLSEVNKLEYPADSSKPIVDLSKASFSPDCKRIVAFNESGTKGIALVWDVSSKDKVVELKRQDLKTACAHLEPILSAAFSENGKQLVTTSIDDSAVVWSFPEWKGQVLQGKDSDLVKGHTADVTTAVFDRRGSRVVTGGADRQVIIWERDAGGTDEAYRPKTVLPLVAAPVHVLLSPEEEQKHIVTIDAKSTAQLWDAKRGRVVATKLSPGEIRQVAWESTEQGKLKLSMSGLWTPEQDGQRIVAPVGDSRGREFKSRLMFSEWDLTPIELDESERISKLAQMTAGRRIVDFGNNVALAPLRPSEVYKLWETLSALPENRVKQKVTDKQILEWHLREASWAQAAGDWSAAQFHLKEAVVNPSGMTSRALLRVRLAMISYEAAAAAQHLVDSQESDEAEDLNSRKEAGQKLWEKAEADLSIAIEGSPEQRDLLVKRADALYHLRRFVDAGKDYKAALELRPEDDEIRSKLADALREGMEYLDALPLYDDVLRRDDSNPDLLFGRAFVLTKSEGESVTQAFSDYVAAGQQYTQQKKYKDAIRAFSGAIGLLKKGAEVSAHLKASVYAERAEVQRLRAVNLSNEAMRRRLHEIAIKDFQAALGLDDSSETCKICWIGLARCYEHRADTKDALASCEKAYQLSPADLDVAKLYGSLLFAQNNYAKAAEVYQKAVELHPADVGLAISYASLAVRQRDWSLAGKVYRAIIHIDKANPFHRVQLAAITLNSVQDLFSISAEQLIDAEACLSQAVVDIPVDEPGARSLWLRLALVQLSAGKIDEYKFTCQKMTEIHKSPETRELNSLVRTLALSELTSTDHAEAAAKLATKLQADASSLNTQGITLYRTGMFEDAITQLRRSLKRVPRTGAVWKDEYVRATDYLFIAMAQRRRGLVEKASDSLNAAIHTMEDLERSYKSDELPSDSLDRFWDRLEWALFLDEAKRLIEP